MFPFIGDIAEGTLALWYPYLLDLADGADVEEMDAASGSTTITSTQTLHPVLDADGIDSGPGIVIDTSAVACQLTTGVFVNETDDWTVSFRANISSFGGSGSNFCMMFGVAAASDGVVRIYAAYDRLYFNYGDLTPTNGSPSLVPTGADQTVTFTHDASATQIDMYIDDTLSQSFSYTTLSPDMQSFSFGSATANQNYGAYTIGNICQFPMYLSSSQVATLSAWMATVDADHLGTQQRYLRCYGLPTGTRLQLYNRPHAQQARINFGTLTPAAAAGKYFNFETPEQYSCTTQSAGSSTITLSASPATNTPTSGTITIKLVATGEYESYPYSGISGAVVTLDSDTTDSALTTSDEAVLPLPRYLWLDDGVESDPAPSGRTGTAADISGAIDADDLADETASALDGLTFVSASASAATAYWGGTRNAALGAPADVDTTATITEIASGGIASDLISQTASTSLEVEELLYSVARPYEASIGAWHPDYVTTWLRIALTIDSYTLAEGTLLTTRDDAYRAENDPSWTHGTQWEQDSVSRELTLSTAGRLDQLYYEVKYRQGTATAGLQDEPFLEPADYGNAFSLRNCTWASGSVPYILDDGFRVLGADGAEDEAWACIKSGANTLEGTAYRTVAIDGTPADFSASGIVNECVQIRDGATLDVSGINVFARPWGKEFKRVSTGDIGASYLDGQQYYLGLGAVVDDDKNTTARSTVATWTDVTLTPGHSTEATYDWSGAIDGGGRTAEQVYERCKYLTDEDQTGTIDGTAGPVFRGLGELYLPYTGASGALTGNTVTGGTSGATARVVANHGDALTVRLVSDSQSLEFVAAETLTGTGWSATAGTPDPYALPNGAPICWFEGDDLIFARGWWAENLSGSVKLTAADGTAYSPPVSVALELTGLVVGSEVRVYLDADGTELDGVEECVSSSWSTTYTGTFDVTIVVHLEGYQYWRLEGQTLPTTGISIPVQQRADNNFSNPA